MRHLETWNLERRNGELHWEGCSLSGLAAQYGTPLFVISRRKVEDSAREIRDIFRNAGLRAEVFFSYKTNPVPKVLQALAQIGIGAEVISELELKLAQKLGLEGDKIIVNGSTKSEALLRSSVDCEVKMIAVQRLAELLNLQKIGAEAGKKVNVGLRINPGLRKRMFNFTVATGSSSSPLGFVIGSKEWKTALAILSKNPLFRFRGLHFHIGSGIKESSPYREAMKNMIPFLDDLMSQGLVPEVLDIGGGFNIFTLKELGLWDAVRLFVWNKPQKPPNSRPHTELLSEVAEVCANSLFKYAQKAKIQVPMVFVEPGRAISASSQLLLLGVKSVVERKNGASVICDGGAMSLSQLLLSEYHHIFVANKVNEGPKKKYTLYGSLPTPLDLVAAQRELPLLTAGDVIAVMDTGAYFTSLGNNFAGPRPAIIMLEDGVPDLIRRKETFEDLFSRDKILWARPGI